MIITGTKKPCQTTNQKQGSVAITEGCKHMSSLALSFNEVNFSPVAQNGQIWLTAPELASALGYSKSDAVGQVYERNKDEFNSSMTTTITVKSNDSIETLNLSVSKKTKNLTKTIRIFSLRGAHLIAMFSKTAIAKQFRKWVLDILDREVLGKQIESRQSVSPEQQALLHEIVARRSKGERKIFAEMWSRHNRHFKIARYSQLLAIHFPEAIHYLETMDIKAKTEKQEAKSNTIEVNKHFHDNAHGLALHMIWAYKWWKEFGPAIRIISPRMAGAINDHFIDGYSFATFFVDKPTRLDIDEKVEYYPWHLNHAERLALYYKDK